MRLTEEKLKALWKIRKQIFDNPANKVILTRYEKVSELFKEIETCNLAPNEEGRFYIFNDGKEGNENIEVRFKEDETKPSIDCYFSCAEDEVTRGYAFDGVNAMCSKFPESLSSIIKQVGCLLGGFELLDDQTTSPAMIAEFRIISNIFTGKNDDGSLKSTGIVRHPSSNLADNNYFFNVINTIQSIADNSFDCDKSKLVLRCPDGDKDKVELEEEQKNILRYRFPYKFFYIWTHDVLHPVSLLAYKNLVKQEDEKIRYEWDKGMNQDFDEFRKDNEGWQKYSEKIRAIISENERGENFWDEMSKLISIIMLQDQQIKNSQELLETGNKAIILYGPPGTGKTYTAKELVRSVLGVDKEEKLEDYKLDEREIKDKGVWTLVQFHPNYTYEDFIGGISPQLNNSNLSYTLKEGIFKKLCDTAAKEENKDKKFIIIIDEINRADLSSVFGELMYALEYRGEKVSIPNFTESFTIPKNVYLIGTMNNVDKSLVTFDLALRRRFAFIKIMPQLSVLEDILADYNIEENCLTAFIERCTKLNESISKKEGKFQLSEDYQIGHAYYGKIKDFLQRPQNEPDNQKESLSQIISTFDLEKLWEYHLEPLLEEFLGNRIDDAEIKEEYNKCKEDFVKPLE